MTTGGTSLRMSTLAMVGGALCLAVAASPVNAQCVGDCNGDNMVEINELILGVNISLGSQPVSACPAFDCEHNGTVPINCLIQGVNNALNGCGGSCPLAAGVYTITQIDGGALSVSTLTPFPFPSGGTIVEDVKAGSQPDCIHNVVVPFPGGLTTPLFCVPSLGFTVQLTQIGCGIGQIDSNGGSDYTVKELGDTSSEPECNNQQACTDGVDNKVRVDVTVGDGIPDTCSAGTANAIVSIPVNVLSWLERGSASCPADDGMYNPDTDLLVLDVNQILDLTTDTNDAQWSDLSGDGCPIAGRGPLAGLSNTGICLDLAANTIGIAASATVGSANAPLFDFTFSARLLNSISGPNASTGATCDSPPLINFNGTVVRCLE